MNNLWKLSIAIFLIGNISLPPFSLAQQGGSVTPEQIQKAKEALRQQVPVEKPEEKLVDKQTERQPAELPHRKDRLSLFEAFIQGKRSLTVSTEIKQFGYDLFEQPPSTFAPVDIVPVGPDYILGPGDEIRISLWGKVNEEYVTIIDREGKISLPQIGVLLLSGLTFLEAKTFLDKEISRYYKPSEVKMNVSMGRLRTIRIFVVGNTERPGSYTLSSLSTLINALFAAGGPSKIGTMRDIQVKRNGETIVHFDIYDFLLKGDKTKDIRLMPEDAIFIPIVGSLAGIAGNVKNPAIYELKGEAKLFDLIQMAGGLTAMAFKGRVQVQRIEDHQSRVIFEGDLIDIEKNPEKNFAIKDGDLVKVFSVAETTDWRLYRTVKISGEVKSPGEYTIKKGETLSSLIERAGGFTERAYLKGAIFTRESVKELQQAQLDEAIDRLEQQILSQSAITIEAAITPESAQQQKAATEQKRSLVAKMRAAKAKGRITIKLDTPERLKGSPSDITLEQGDTLTIPEIPQQVQVMGSVYNQTSFIYEPEETTDSYLKKSGGLTRDADKNEIYILKVDGTAVSKREVWGFMSSMPDPGDTIVVPERIERIAWLREIKDITQILYQIAVTAGVLIVVF